MGKKKQKAILAIDDNATQLKIFEKFLSSSYELALVKSAYEAMGLLQARNFDLILLDIEMPDVSGFEFLHEIRKIPQYMSKPVIIVTSHSEPDILSHAKHSSTSGVLTKPVNSKQLFKAIELAFSGPAVDPFHL
ncbi:MAG: response regulator [Treponema sp.]|nr:response regulator [Treponema sp.]